MYELVQVRGNSYYFQSPAKIGLVRISDNDVVLIDSGSDKDAGRKVRQQLDANGWKLKAIFNLNLQESPSSKRSERWRGMEEETSGMIRLQYEEMAG